MLVQIGASNVGTLHTIETSGIGCMTFHYRQ